VFEESAIMPAGAGKGNLPERRIFGGYRQIFTQTLVLAGIFRHKWLETPANACVYHFFVARCARWLAF
jgi:hypothetical protein